MAKYEANFQLKQPNGDKKTEIRLRVGFDYSQLTWNIKDSFGRVLKIYPFLWDKTTQHPIRPTKIPPKYKHEKSNLEIIDKVIDDVKKVINQIINESVIQDLKIDKNYLKQELLIRLNLAKKEEEITLYRFTDEIIKEMETGTFLIPKSKKRYSSDTITQYKVLRTVLNVFLPKTQFSEINQDWYNRYINFLTYKQEIEYKDEDGIKQIYQKNDLEPSSIGNYIKTLKFILKIANEKGVSHNLCYKDSWFSRPSNSHSNTKTELYLNETEIRKIYEKKLTSKGKEYAKDLFLIGCYTGLRISDYTNLTKSNFKTTKNGIKAITKHLKKGTVPVTIPIIYKELIDIVEKKYNFDLPKLSDQKVNKYIKEICKEIKGFDETITVSKILGGKLINENFEKWELITSHTGRRSAITNLINRGLAESEVLKFTGQKSSAILRRYIKSSNDETAERIVQKLNKLKGN